MGLKKFTALFFLIGLSQHGVCQKGSHYSIPLLDNTDSVVFDFNLAASKCILAATSNPSLLKVYSDVTNAEDFETSLRYDPGINNKGVAEVSLDVQKKSGFSISEFTGNNKGISTWNLFLNKTYHYDIGLTFGIGEAFINLSGLPIKKLNIRTGGAYTIINYLNGQPNETKMDSFNLKMEVGSVEIHRFNLSKARVFTAEVGFGKLFIDFSQEITDGSHLDIKVGAGNLKVVIPRTSHDNIAIYVKDTKLSNVDIPIGFEKRGDKFVSNNYDASATDNLLSFDIDVTVGNVTFAYK